MKRRTWLWTGIVAVGAATLLGAASSTAAVADDVHVQNIVFERLTGFQEDPLVFSTPGSATFAATSNVRQLVLTHLSGRYEDGEILAEAAKIFPDVRIAADFDRITV